MRCPRHRGARRCTCRACRSGHPSASGRTARRTASETCCSWLVRSRWIQPAWCLWREACRPRSRRYGQARGQLPPCLRKQPSRPVIAPRQMLRNEQRVLEVLNSRPGHVMGATLYVAASVVAASGDAWGTVAAAFSRWASLPVSGGDDDSTDGDSVASDVSSVVSPPPSFTLNACCDESCVATQVRVGVALMRPCGGGLTLRSWCRCPCRLAGALYRGCGQQAS